MFGKKLEWDRKTKVKTMWK